MKKSILSIAVALAALTSAFAGPESLVNEKVKVAFHNEFRQASEVSWKQTDHFLRATFQVNKQTLYAYYDNQGNMMGLVQNILTTSLPENLRTELKKYEGYWVTELFHVANDNGGYYFIELRNADSVIVLSSEGTESWHRYTTPHVSTACL